MAYTKRKAFTLLEVIITATLFFLVVTVVTVLFIEMVKVKWWLDARQNLAKESYYLMEKLQVMSKNYTIDYEEYRNRQKVGCISTGASAWSGSTNCSVMTYYGNRNALWASILRTDNVIYYCSSVAGVESQSQPVVEDNISSFPCIPAWFSMWVDWFTQPYGQYAALFTDVKGDVDNNPSAVKDDDDLDMWDGPSAIFQSTGVQEIYLISHDGTHRLFLRRKLIEQWDRNRNGITWDNDSEKLYTIQVLQLKWLDAGQSHNFASSGTYDGTIDTWVCDASVGFLCSGPSVGWAYPNYRLPSTSNDGRTNLFPPDITVSSRNIIAYPTKDPKLAWSGSVNQISPHMYITVTTKLYGKNRSGKIKRSQMDLYSLRLQTMLWLPYLGSKK